MASTSSGTEATSRTLQPSASSRRASQLALLFSTSPLVSSLPTVTMTEVVGADATCGEGSLPL